MSRKTFSVEEFKNNMNNMLANSIVDREVREGIIFSLEDLLHKTGNYRGFEYLLKSEVPKGELPGINGVFEDYDLNFKNTDNTRRKYF